MIKRGLGSLGRGGDDGWTKKQSWRVADLLCVGGCSTMCPVLDKERYLFLAHRSFACFVCDFADRQRWR